MYGEIKRRQNVNKHKTESPYEQKPINMYYLPILSTLDVDLPGPVIL